MKFFTFKRKYIQMQCKYCKKTVEIKPSKVKYKENILSHYKGTGWYEFRCPLCLKINKFDK